jgi:hypothetical protein
MTKQLTPFFFKEIEKYDLVFLTETHVGYNTDIHTIGPFHYHRVYAGFYCHFSIKTIFDDKCKI